MVINYFFTYLELKFKKLGCNAPLKTVHRRAKRKRILRKYAGGVQKPEQSSVTMQIITHTAGKLPILVPSQGESLFLFLQVQSKHDPGQLLSSDGCLGLEPLIWAWAILHCMFSITLIYTGEGKNVPRSVL